MHKTTYYFSVVAFLLVTMYFQQQRYVENIDNYSVDEVHTINYALDRYYGSDVKVLRVGETPRLMAMLLHPLAQYYLNTKMGGFLNVTTWWYPGGHYIRKNFTGVSGPEARKIVNKDPVIQDYVFAMRSMLGLLALASVLLPASIVRKIYSDISALSYVALSSVLIITGKYLDFFYSEATVFIFFNLFIWVMFRFKEDIRRYIVYGSLVLALLISSKLFAAMLLIPFVYYQPSLRQLNVESFERLLALFATMFLSYVLINGFTVFNLNTGSLPSLIDQQLTNIFHYATGHGTSQPSGAFQWNKFLSFNALVVATYSVLFLVNIIWIKRSPHLSLSLVLIVVALILMGSLLGAHYYVDRNYFLPLLITSLAVSVLIQAPRVRRNSSFAVVLLVAFFVFYSNLEKGLSLDGRLDRASSEFYKGCSSPVSVGVEFDSVELLPSIPDIFNLKADLRKMEENYKEFDCIAVHSADNNKHLSKFILTKTHDLEHRVGETLFFRLK